MNIFDETGIKTHGIDEVRKTMADEASVRFADVLEGRPLRADDSSILGRTFATVAKPIVENSDILPQILASLDPNSVEGQAMDNLFETMYRIKRKDSAQANGLLLLQGRMGIFVGKGSEVANSITGDLYQTDSDIRFESYGATGVVVKINSRRGSFTLYYSVDGLLSYGQPVTFVSSDKDDTDAKIADRLVNAVKTQTSYLDAKRNNDNTVTITLIDQSKTGAFDVIGDMEITQSIMPVYATAATYNSRESLVGQVSSIRTSQSGWISVTNPFYIPESQAVESDEDYRYRAKIKHSLSLGSDYDSILMAIKSVKGVTYENLLESYNTTNNNIVSNGVHITVMGGNPDDIALAIFNTVGAGIATVGDEVREVLDINGTPHEVRFSRPQPVSIQVTMSLEIRPDFPSNGLAQIRNALVDWFNSRSVGEPIYYSRVYEPINSVRGFAVRDLKIGLVGNQLSTENIYLQPNQIASIYAEDIKIGGN